MKAAVGFCWYLLESQDGAIQLCPCSHWNAFGAELTHIFDNGTNGLSRDKWFMKSTRCKTNDIIWDKYICSRYASSLSIAKDLVYFVRHWGVTGICKGHCVFCLKLQAQGMRGWIWSQQKMKSLRISSDPSVIVVMVWEREREIDFTRALINPQGTAWDTSYFFVYFSLDPSSHDIFSSAGVFSVCSLSKESQTIKVTLPFYSQWEDHWRSSAPNFQDIPLVPLVPLSASLLQAHLWASRPERSTRWIQNVGLRQNYTMEKLSCNCKKNTIGYDWMRMEIHFPPYSSVFQGVTPTPCTRNLLADKLLNEADAFIKVQVLGLRSDKHPTSNYGKNQDTLPNLYMSDCIS